LDEEMNQLLIDIKRIGVNGVPNVTFGELFDDDNVQQYYEALVGTLKCAKKRGLIDYKGVLLLKGVSDDVIISILNSS
jgi:Costars